MGKVVVSEFVSVDGVYEDPGGSEGTPHAGWTFTFDRGADGDAYKLDEVRAADALLLGRVTYEGFAAVWPTVTDEAGFADKMNSMPKHVVSSTLGSAEWANSTIIRPDGGGVAAAVRTMKEEYAGNILVAGSGTLVRTLLEAGLVDELNLMVFPIVLGSGRQLLDGAATTRLALAGVQQVGPDGVAVLSYTPTGS